MKRIGTLLLVLVLALGLTACDRGMIRDAKEAVETMLPTANVDPAETMEPMESAAPTATPEPIETPPVDVDTPDTSAEPGDIAE